MKQVSAINQQADQEETTLRLSLDAKARVKLGEFDRGGKTRVKTLANDHDFAEDKGFEVTSKPSDVRGVSTAKLNSNSI